MKEDFVSNELAPRLLYEICTKTALLEAQVHELARDFSAGDDYPREVNALFREFVPAAHVLAKSNPNQLVDAVLEYLGVVHGAVFELLNELVNYHLAQFSVAPLALPAGLTTRGGSGL